MKKTPGLVIIFKRKKKKEKQPRANDIYIKKRNPIEIVFDKNIFVFR
jgi:hypothetical protein